MEYQHLREQEGDYNENGNVYCVEIVTSVMKEDGKRHLETLVQAFPSKEEAIAFCDSFPDEKDGVKLKIGKVWEIVPVFEPVLARRSQ